MADGAALSSHCVCQEGLGFELRGKIQALLANRIRRNKFGQRLDLEGRFDNVSG